MNGNINFGLILIFAVLYLAFPPGLLAGLKALKNYIKDALFGRKRSRTAINAQNQKEGFNVKLSKRIKFTLKDPRNKPAPFRLLFILIYISGFILAIIGGFTGKWGFLLLSFIVYYLSNVFAYISANKIVKERDTVLKRMLELKGSKMRFVNKDKNATPNPATEFKVLEWGDDLVSPVKMHLYMPTDFDILEVDRFLESFNLIFGANGQWISDDTDKDYGGFDFNAGVAAIKVSAKLPQRADWHMRYLSDKDIHWSYFPLALGSENGVPIYNEEKDTTEHVLGFAVNSGQEKLSKKNGVIIGPEITSAPQILIAGGTGGGKSLHVKTPVKMLIENDNEGL